MRKALMILGQLDEPDVDWMIAHGTRTRLRASETLIRQDEEIKAFFVVLSGSLIVRDDKLGRDIARLGAGDVVGEMSFIDARPPSATVAAACDSEVLTLPRPVLAKKLQEDAAFAARFYRALATFLSDRLRATIATLGSNASPANPDDMRQSEDLDPAVLAYLQLASARFTRMVTRAQPATHEA